MPADEYPTVPGEPVAMAFPLDDIGRVRRTPPTTHESAPRRSQGASPSTASTHDPMSEEDSKSDSSADNVKYPIIRPPPARSYFDADNHAALGIVHEVTVELMGVDGFSHMCPKVVVIGSQSSGKSSLLTTMTKYALPAKEGMATRAAMSFSVEGGKVANNSLAVKRKSEKHWTPVPYDDPNALDAQITAITNAMCAPGEINAGEVIQVRLRRPTGPTFAVIDVPGITCLSSNHDNPNSNIETETVELTKKMIGTEPSTIVIVVLPATEDFANSKALSLIDNMGVAHRTIAVVTKIDNLPPGSNLKERMSPEFCDKYAKLGLFAVRNRTQQEADEGMCLDLLPHKEADLFRTNPALSELPEEQQGLERLLDKLSREQRRLMIELVPQLKAETHKQFLANQDEFNQIPKPFPDGATKIEYIAGALREIEKQFEVCMTGGAGGLGVGRVPAAHLCFTVMCAFKDFQKDLAKKTPQFLDDATVRRLADGAYNQRGYALCVHDPNEEQMFQTEWKNSVHHVLTDAAKMYPHEVASRVNACLDALVDGNDKLRSIDASSLCSAIKQKFHEAVHNRCSLAHDWALDAAEAENGVGSRLTLNAAFEDKMTAYDKWDKRIQGERGTYTGPTDLPEAFVNAVCATHALRGELQSREREVARRVQVTLYYFNKIVRDRFVDTVALNLRKKIVHDTLVDLGRASIVLPRELADLVEEYPAHVAERAQVLSANIERLRNVVAKLNQV